MPGVHSVIGVDAGTVSLREADHLIHDLVDRLGLPPGTLACTHLIRTEGRRGAAVSLALPDRDGAEAAWRRPAALGRPDVGAALGGRERGPAEASRTAALAAAEHADRRAGRAVVYPGASRLTGTVTVADLFTLTAIDHVTVVGTPSTDGPGPAAPVLTRDHVRPEWREGRLTLALVPAVGGTLAPFEVPNPTPCCADHA
ncbi:hypothetical protein [Streptomyces sp. MK7]|uniref:hypothetical protein n=1 Tax=Streptomyces sp. MK7 TaxID=3067635 RepID=UPI00292DACF4|nr:hypothetical protein [Streptomyces sp. MK7]